MDRAPDSQRTNASSKLERRKYSFITIDKSLSDWSAQQSWMQFYLMPERIDDIINYKPLMSCEPEKTFVKIAANPFAIGAKRIVYNGLDMI